jgi:hypothetical protein
MSHTLYTLDRNNFNKFLRVVNSKLEHLSFTLHTGTDMMDFPQCPNLESLECSSKHIMESLEILKQHCIRKLSIDRINLPTLYPYLSNVTDLTVQKLGGNTLSTILKLPALKYLRIRLFTDSYAAFTNICAAMALQPHHIVEIIVEDFASFVTKKMGELQSSELISLLPSTILFQIHFRSCKIDESEYNYTEAWLLILASCFALDRNSKCDTAGLSQSICSSFFSALKPSDRSTQNPFQHVLRRNMAVLNKNYLNADQVDLHSLKAKLDQGVLERFKRRDPFICKLVEAGKRYSLLKSS